MSWVRVDSRVWNDRRFRELSHFGQLLWFAILTHPHMTPIGALRISIEGLASELKTTPEDIKKAYPKAFGEGLGEGFPEALGEAFIEDRERLPGSLEKEPLPMWIWDVEAGVIVVPNFVRYNPPVSPNVVKRWPRHLDGLPDCDLVKFQMSAVYEHVKGFHKAFREAFGEAFGEGFIAEIESLWGRLGGSLGGRPFNVLRMTSIKIPSVVVDRINPLHATPEQTPSTSSTTTKPETNSSQTKRAIQEHVDSGARALIERMASSGCSPAADGAAEYVDLACRCVQIAVGRGMGVMAPAEGWEELCRQADSGSPGASRARKACMTNPHSLLPHTKHGAWWLTSLDKFGVEAKPDHRKEGLL